MGFFRHLAIFLGSLALLFAIVAASLAAVAYGTWALQNADAGPLPLSGSEAAALMLLGFLLLPAMLLGFNVNADAEHRRRYGVFAFAAGLPDLAIAWTFVAALVTPLLIDTRRDVMAALFVVECIASYTTIMLVSLA